MEVLSQENVKNYILSLQFRDGQLPVETAMCDNFKGWGNFSNNALSIHFNVCFLHGTSVMPFFYWIMPQT